jgi:hypothetical protein
MLAKENKRKEEKKISNRKLNDVWEDSMCSGMKK